MSGAKIWSCSVFVPKNTSKPRKNILCVSQAPPTSRLILSPHQKFHCISSIFNEK